jgi:transcriptional regulator with XRE-family HTH domain
MFSGAATRHFAHHRRKSIPSCSLLKFRAAWEAPLAQRLTRTEVAEQLDIPQQTLARYEFGESRFSVALLLEISRILRFAIDEMLATRAPGRSKRGPASRLEQQIDAVARLPKAKQRFVADMLDTILASSRAGEVHRRS